MFSIGTIFQFTRGTTVVTSVSIWEQKGIKYILSNPEEVPKPWPDFGIFQYNPQDQYCRWVDVRNIEMKKD
jgi:hypothetical protein